MNNVSTELREKLPNEPAPPDRGLSRRRRRVARLLGAGTVIGLGAAVAFGAWGHATRRTEAVATLAAMHTAE
jgi:hypothetical protein